MTLSNKYNLHTIFFIRIRQCFQIERIRIGPKGIFKFYILNAFKHIIFTYTVQNNQRMSDLKHSISSISSSQLTRLRQLPVDEFLERLFNKFDENSDGRLSKFEFTEVIKVISRVTRCTFPKREDIQDLFAFIDTDGDLTISRNEYKQLTKHIYGLMRDCNIELYQKIIQVGL